MPSPLARRASWAVPLARARGRSAIALQAIQFGSDPAGAAFWCQYPRPLDKGRRMADVLLVAAFKLGNPIAFGVAVEANNSPLHSTSANASPVARAIAR